MTHSFESAPMGQHLPRANFHGLPTEDHALISPPNVDVKTPHSKNQPGRRILLIDDDLDMHELCRHCLEKAGYEFLSAYTGSHGLELIRQGVADLVLLDFMMPGTDGYSVFKELMTGEHYRHVRDVPVIMLTAYSEHNKRQDLIEMGLKMHLAKPFGGQELINVIENVFFTSRVQERFREQERHQLEKVSQENLILRSLLRDTCDFDNIVGTNRKMKEIFEKVMKVASTDANIMIYGESGTGKELIARSIHTHSHRSKGPFIAVDCVALPGNLLESELFGYERGAFTGAYASKRGLLELAHEGTFFLDEICELNLDLQAKLLRVLQERQFRHLGGKNLVTVDIRVISATNRDPLEAVKEKQLRQDLYYRLNVIPIYLPPLRERRDDIPLLANFFLRKFCRDNKRQMMRFSDEALAHLGRYSWPGNVRELQNVVERMVSLANGRTIRVDDLPEYLHEDEAPPESDDFQNLTLREARQHWMAKFERKYLLDLLNRYNGNISRVARKAGVHRMTIYRMLKQYNITIRTAIDRR